MFQLLLAIIYLAFISLGLPDSLPGSAWPTMYQEFSISHSTPEHFGADRSQTIIGVQMASAYVGTCLMPLVFGLIANHISISLYPVFLLVILILMVVMHEKMLPKVSGK